MKGWIAIPTKSKGLLFPRPLPLHIHPQDNDKQKAGVPNLQMDSGFQMGSANGELWQQA